LYIAFVYIQMTGCMNGRGNNAESDEEVGIFKQRANNNARLGTLVAVCTTNRVPTSFRYAVVRLLCSLVWRCTLVMNDCDPPLIDCDSMSNQ
jgi:hypothetical protein